MVMCTCNCSEHGKLLPLPLRAHSHVATDIPERVARRSRLSENRVSCNRTKDSAVVYLEEEADGRQGSPLEGMSQQFNSSQVS